MFFRLSVPVFFKSHFDLDFIVLFLSITASSAGLSDSAGIEPRTFATLARAVRLSNQ